jgi:crotonobetainyl-CoA:carnitine CoA-transferase CaiB-like acyl-CoA transferase
MSDQRLLDGLTVLDFTRVLAGPYCTRMMADLGARVIKVERPGEGDDTRRGYIQLEPGRQDQSSYFTRINAGKLSVAIDLGREEAKPVVLDLARHADVVIENFVPGVIARLGADHRALARVKPDLVYCSISGFGQTGPLRSWPAFAHIVHALSGIMDLDRDPDPSPRVEYLQAADVLAGAHAFGAILAALFRRGRTGQGAYLDVSMLETLIAAEDITYGSVLNGGPEYRGPRPGMLVQQVGGRWLVTQTVGAPQLWPRLLKLMGRPDLDADPRFATPLLRRQNWPALQEIMSEWLGGFQTLEQAQQALAGARLPTAPVLTPTEVAALPHLAERQFFPSVPHPVRGEVRITAIPFHVDHQPVAPGGPAPYLPGEHTRMVLEKVLEYPPSRIDALLSSGAVVAS